MSEMTTQDKVYQIMTPLFKRVVEDSKRLHPGEPGAYALSVMTACMGIAMRYVIEKCNVDEIDEIKHMLEHTVAVSEIMATDNLSTFK